VGTLEKRLQRIFEKEKPMKLVNDWARERIEFLGIVASEGERGQSVHLNKGELATLKKALAILEQLRLAQDPYGNGDYGDGTPDAELVTSAECFLWELLDAFPEGRIRVDLFDCGHKRETA